MTRIACPDGGNRRTDVLRAPVCGRFFDEPLDVLTLRLLSPRAFLLGLPRLACHSDDHLAELPVELASPLVPDSEVRANPVRPCHMQ